MLECSFLLHKTVMQKNGIVTLNQNGESLKQKAGLCVMTGLIRNFATDIMPTGTIDQIHSILCVSFSTLVESLFGLMNISIYLLVVMINVFVIRTR